MPEIGGDQYWAEGHFFGGRGARLWIKPRALPMLSKCSITSYILITFAGLGGVFF
jgi:hypothetical protein